MFLHGKMTKGGSKVYSEKLPELLSAEASFQLWLEIKAGAPVVNTLIEGNMRIAAAIAARYSEFLTWAKHDLYCEAMLGLTQAANNVKNCDFKEPGALRGYLRKRIHGHAGKFISNCINGFTIDTKQVQRIKNGKDSQFKTLDDLTNIATVDILPDKMTVEQGREHLTDRMERLMKDAGLEEIEYKILLFYMAGYTEEATASELKISKTNVHYRKIEAVEKMRYIFFDPSVDLESIEDSII